MEPTHTSKETETAPRPRPAWHSWARDLCLFALIYLGIAAYQSRGAASGPAPPLVASLLDGSPVSLDDYRGRPVLVYFWASWCGVCEATQGNVQALAADLPVLTVASGSGDAAGLRRHLSERGLELPVVADPAERLARAFGVRAYPTTFVIDAGGQVSQVSVGYMTELGLRARMWLSAIM